MDCHNNWEVWMSLQSESWHIWGRSLGCAEPMKCAPYCSNPDLVQSQLSLICTETHPSWYLPVKLCEVTLLWKQRLTWSTVGKMLGCSGFPVLAEQSLGSCFGDRVGCTPASSVPTPARDLLQHLQIVVTSNLLQSEGVTVLPGRPWCNWWQNMLLIFLQKQGTHQRQMFHLNFSWAAEEAEARLNPRSDRGGLGGREVCHSFETGSWLPKAKGWAFPEKHLPVEMELAWAGSGGETGGVADGLSAMVARFCHFAEIPNWMQGEESVWLCLLVFPGFKWSWNSCFLCAPMASLVGALCLCPGFCL